MQKSTRTEAYAIAGVAVTVWAGGQSLRLPHGVTNVDAIRCAVTATLSRIGSHHRNFHRYGDDARLVRQRQGTWFCIIREPNESANATVTVRQLPLLLTQWDGHK